MITQTYSIRDLEQISGIKAHTIRIWEKRYHLFSPDRTSTNIRYYSDEDLRKLLNIQILLGKGFRISKVAGLTDEELAGQVRLAASIPDSGSLIDSLLIDMVSFNRKGIDQKVDRLLLTLGFEEAVKQVIWPFYSRVGLLWLSGAINPAQEHFITNIFKQKFFIAIDSLDVTLPEQKTFLLFLPEQEQHELGLLYAWYLVRKAGHRAIYLGQNLPMTDVVKTCSALKPDYLFTFFTTAIPGYSTGEWLESLTGQLPGTPVLCSGPRTADPDISSLPGVRILTSPADLSGLLSGLQ